MNPKIRIISTFRPFGQAGWLTGFHFEKPLLFPGVMSSNETKKYHCICALYGRYVAVYLVGSGILSLCEVQIFETAGTEPFFFVQNTYLFIRFKNT